MRSVLEVRRGAYHDSVALMQVSQDVAAVDGVSAALVAMATELNLDLLAGMGFDQPEDASPNDMVVAIRVDDEAALPRAQDVLERSLAGLGARTGDDGTPDAAAPPRTPASAARLAHPGLALVSVPGRYAFAESMDALEAGLSVMVFSDNVPVEQEIRLKDEAARRGLLVMGPDCGTAMVGGVGLGFANVVRTGTVGVVAASGTGAQQLTCLLDAAGVGVSHVLGLGGRDLSAKVGGRSMLAALAALDADPGTDVVVAVSKPPAEQVAAVVREAAEALATPTFVALLGRGRDDLTTVAERAVAAAGGQVERWPQWPPADLQRPRPGALRGLFAGGTLCDEAMAIAAETLGPIASNIPLEPGWALPPGLRAEGHLMIDFGDDRLTEGRPHPMIDQSLRLDRLAEEAADPRTAVVLLDVVLGHAAHPDPAAELAPAITTARSAAADEGRELAVVVSLCGTSADPQGLERQAHALRDAGAHVFLSNAQAARHAVALVAPRSHA